MTLPLSREMLRASYDYLTTTPPFNGWNLPDGEDVVFQISRGRATCGWYRRDGDKHVIAISSACTGHTASLMETMAHEMIHVHEEHSRACKPGVEHSGAFRKWAAQVCRFHGFDPKAF